MNDEQKAAFNKQTQEFREGLPGRVKEVTDVLRLIELAKTAPFAGVNADFIERMEVVWKERKSQNDMVSSILRVIEKVGEP